MLPEIKHAVNAVTVEECAIAQLVVAAIATHTPGRSVLDEAVESWRRIRPAVQAVAETNGLKLTDLVGWSVAVSIVAEAATFIDAEDGALR
ncbi:hypothetical protein [Microbacterium sp. MM2322]|uniref:hypothetical protein n=1 Tax=Microbacterium sp. MM2322 TaxID=3157631 RepID=UPI0032D59F19